MKAKLFRAILRALAQCDGVPMPESALISAVNLLCRPEEPTNGEITDAIKDLSESCYIDGVTDELMGGHVWQITPKGVLKARALR